MPIYEYQCQSCGHQLEAFQKISEAPLCRCPVCHEDTLNKLVSAAGFQLKGSGWYATDYRNKEKAPTNDNPDKPASNDKKETTSTSSTSKESSSKETTNTGNKDSEAASS